MRERGEKITITDLRVGYEVRCARPVPFDVDYTRTLGYGAARVLLMEPRTESERTGGVICMHRGGHLKLHPFDEFRDPETGRTRVRLVDVESEGYRVARQYMIRLEARDLEDPVMLQTLADAARMRPEAFREKFARAVRGKNGVRT
jgi:6-phosphofructokinase 1